MDMIIYVLCTCIHVYVGVLLGDLKMIFFLSPLVVEVFKIVDVETLHMCVYIHMRMLYTQLCFEIMRVLK